MLGKRIRLFSVRGIPVRIDISWLLIFVWITWSLAASYFPGRYPDWSTALYWGTGVATSLLFFGSVLLHELGHSLVALRQGLPVHDITLFIFGGVSQIAEEPRSPKQEAVMAAIGPGISLLLGGVFFALYYLSRRALEPLGAAGLFLGTVNLSLAVFNLIPGFPLDGGRVLRAILWQARHDLRWATRWASMVGQGVAYLFILFGVVMVLRGQWLNGLWIAFIGLFLDNAARSSYAQLTLRDLLRGHTVGEAMSTDCTVIPPQLTLDVAVEQYLVGRARRCYVVGVEGNIDGLLTIHNLRDVPRAAWTTTRVRDVLTALADLKTVAPSTPLLDALQEMTTEGVNQLPVLLNGELEGMITRENLVTFIEARSQLGED